MEGLLAQGIIDTARAIGTTPLDLATVMSYETGGTFNPTQVGPTTQWGTHRGLIQFGEPQAREYGVDWNDPLGSQLGPDGAVARYFQQNGFRPGMGLLDLYSTVNAGAPGLYTRTDENNGGAPGTVQEKVEQQMDEHRANAERLLAGLIEPEQTMGGASAPTPSEAPSMPGLLSAPQRSGPPSIWDSLEGVPGLGVLADPDRRDRMAIALSGLSMFPNQGMISTIQHDMDARREDEQRQRMAAWLAGQPGGQPYAEALAAGFGGPEMAGSYFDSQRPAERDIREVNGQLIDTATGQVIGDYRTPDAAATQLTGAQVMEMYPGAEVTPGSLYTMAPDGTLSEVSGGGPLVNVDVGPNGTDYGDPGDGLVWQRDPEGNVVTDERGAPIAIPYQGGSVYRSEEERAADAAAAERTSAAAAENSAVANDIVLTDIGRAITMLDEASFFDPVAGFGSGVTEGIRGTAAADMNALLTTVRANIGFDRLQAMREASPNGGALGNITERELAQLQSVMGSLDQSQSPEQLRENLARLQEVYTNIARKAAAYPNAADFGFTGAGASIPPVPDGIDPNMWPGVWEAMPPEDRALFQ